MQDSDAMLKVTLYYSSVLPVSVYLFSRQTPAAEPMIIPICLISGCDSQRTNQTKATRTRQRQRGNKARST